jgi:hypothetical protein
MTLDELLALARASVQSEPNPASVTDRLARGVLELLGEHIPCGFDSAHPNEQPYSTIHIPEQWTGDVTPDEALACAASLVRAVGELKGRR